MQRAGIDIGGSWRGDREVPLFLTSAKEHPSAPRRGRRRRRRRRRWRRRCRRRRAAASS